jgi:hypothetical protein
MVMLGRMLFGSGMKQVPTMTPEQMGILNRMMSQLSPTGQLGGAQSQALEGLQEYMDPSEESYQRFAEPYMRQFEQETLPGIAERFAGASPMGGGALSSSGFGQALGSAGANLQSQLAGMKTGLQRQAIGDILNQYNQMQGGALSAKPFGYQSPQQGMIPGLIGKWAEGGFPGASSGFNQISNMLGFNQSPMGNYAANAAKVGMGGY